MLARETTSWSKEMLSAALPPGMSRCALRRLVCCCVLARVGNMQPSSPPETSLADAQALHVQCTANSHTYELKFQRSADLVSDAQDGRAWVHSMSGA